MCVVSAVRIWAFYRFTVEVDLTWVDADVFLLSSVEPAFGIVSACLPSLRPLYRRARAKMTGKDTRTTTTGTWYANSKASRIGNSYVRFGDDSSRSVEDEIALTSIGKGPVGNKTIPRISSWYDPKSRNLRIKHKHNHQGSVILSNLIKRSVPPRFEVW